MQCTSVVNPCPLDRISDTFYVSTPYIYKSLGSGVPAAQPPARAPAPPPPARASNLEQSGSDSSTFIIIGAAVGGAALVGAVLATVFYMKKRAKKSVTRPPTVQIQVQMTSSADTHPTDKI